MKKKLAHNQLEQRATGGGPYTKYQLRLQEEAIVRICGITRSVEGVAGKSFGTNQDVEECVEVDGERPSTSSKRVPDSGYSNYTPKRARTETCQLNAFLKEDNQNKEALNNIVSELVEAIENSTESVTIAVNALRDDLSNFTSALLEAMQESNCIRQQQLDLDLLKYQYTTGVKK